MVDTINDKFLAPIPSKYVLSKNKSIYLYFNMFDFYFLQSVTKQFLDNLTIDMDYNCLIKIRYNKDSYYMCGSKIGFDTKSYDNVFNTVATIKSRINECLNEYSFYIKYIEYVKINIRKVDEKFLSEFSVTKLDHISESDFSERN
jgi:hypothetical protein